jgi:hypothetical protein
MCGLSTFKHADNANSLLGMLTMDAQPETHTFEINFVASYASLCF